MELFALTLMVLSLITVFTVDAIQKHRTFMTNSDGNA